MFPDLEQVTCDAIMKWSNLDQAQMDDASIDINVHDRLDAESET